MRWWRSVPLQFDSPTVVYVLVVSKSQLLDGLEDEEEDDDDEIDLADLPFDVPKEGFVCKCSISEAAFKPNTKKYLGMRLTRSSIPTGARLRRHQ
jgi:hypothetical protein